MKTWEELLGTQPESDVALATEESPSFKLVVYNDDFNTFEHVINTLVDVCAHSNEQAEQCTLIVHYKGKCVVKSGNEKNMIKMRNQICDRGIWAEVLGD